MIEPFYFLKEDEMSNNNEKKDFVNAEVVNPKSNEKFVNSKEAEIVPTPDGDAPKGGGKQDKKEQHISEVSAEQQDNLDQLIAEKGYDAFAEAAKGPDGVPLTAKEIKDKFAYKGLFLAARGAIQTLSNKATLIERINATDAAFVSEFERSNISICLYGTISGTYFNQLKVVHGLSPEPGEEHLGWTKYADKTFPHIKKTAREMRMNIARIPKVENHFKLGMERLNDLYRTLMSMSAEEKDGLGEDPISTLCDKHGVDVTQPIEEIRISIDAVTEHYKLSSKGIAVNPDVLEKFLGLKLKLTAPDRKHMEFIAKDDDKAPAKYIEDLTVAKGDRTGLLPAKESGVKAITTKVKNIDSQVTKLGQSLDKIITAGKYDGDIDINAIESLVNKLQDIRSKARDVNSFTK
jgi:hypothetical protein